ncbi:MAG: hypothetical protein ACYDBJ_24010 [Aggregatilineales bacterium]
MTKSQGSVGERAGYLLNLINALQIHSSDALHAAVAYLHLTGLSLPLVPMLAHWNDQVIENGDLEQIKRLYAVLADTTAYVQQRFERLKSEPDSKPGKGVNTQPITERVNGMLVTVQIIVRNKANELVPECVQALQSLIDQDAPQLEAVQGHRNLIGEFRQFQTDLINKQWNQVNSRLASIHTESSSSISVKTATQNGNQE